MKIRDAMKLVMEGNVRGVVVYRGELSPELVKHSDFKFSKVKWAKKVMADREKELVKNVQSFIIIKGLGIYDEETDYHISFNNGSVYFDNNLKVGDPVYLEIMGNHSAQWVAPVGADALGHKKRAYEHEKQKDTNEAKKKRDEFKKLINGLSVEEIDCLAAKWEKEREAERFKFWANKQENTYEGFKIDPNSPHIPLDEIGKIIP